MGFIDDIKARAKTSKKTIVLPETEDIRRANRLLYGMAFFGWGICMAVWLCVTAIVW